jgi:hypothetical protein
MLTLLAGAEVLMKTKMVKQKKQGKGKGQEQQQQ